jgi:hypothetical protein
MPQVGDKVSVEFDGTWHAAVVMKVVPAGVEVMYEEDSSASVVPDAEFAARIRPIEEAKPTLNAFVAETAASEPPKTKRKAIAFRATLAQARFVKEPSPKRATGSSSSSSSTSSTKDPAPRKAAEAEEDSNVGGSGSGGNGGSKPKRKAAEVAATTKGATAAPDFAAVPANEWSSREAVASTLSSSQKANMHAAQEIARKHLATLATAAAMTGKVASGQKKRGKLATCAPTTAMVLEALTAVGDTEAWPKQTRPNVTDTGKPVAGMCLGLVFGLGGGGAKASLISECYPDLTKLIVQWCAATLPATRDGASFPFSSLQINYKYRAIKHVDGNNIGPSYIQAIGDHTGGALWTADRGVLACRDQWQLFDGNQEHATEPFDGTRISFIAFTHGLYNKLSPYVEQQLLGYGFNAARSDGAELPFFERFRIEKSYLSDQHNGAFKAFREQRLTAEGMSPPSRPGAVAVECFGRQAERGGGWVSFATTGAAGSKPELVELKPNTTGLWCTELALTATPGAKPGPSTAAPAITAVQLSLVGHRQFNLYKDLAKETASLAAYVAALPAGRVVVISIADTACAAKRPLGPKVYEALQQLGADANMAPIAYRQAWALIGWKGATPGSAVHSMGQRATLLRLEAMFALQPSVPGKGGAGAGEHATVLVSQKEDRTSIVDVVTGGGQDCAV